MKEQGSLGRWLQERCKTEQLSLRQAAAKTRLSHATIRDIMNDGRPSPGTIIKLAHGFGGIGTNERLALEDKLLVLAGYRSERPEEELNELLAQLMDKVRQFNEPQLEMMRSFADFLAEIEDKG
ncbi:hypothetical protein ES703_09374 [subsurface metagenome]